MALMVDNIFHSAKSLDRRDKSNTIAVNPMHGLTTHAAGYNNKNPAKPIRVHPLSGSLASFT